MGDPLAGLEVNAAAPVHGWPGNLVVDRGGAVYEVFVTDGPGQPGDDRFNRIVVASSRDGGWTWRDVTAYQGGAHEDDGNMWPGLAVDAAGHLYAVWSDCHDVYLARSDDGGVTWTAPRRVDTPSALLHTSVLPSVAAEEPLHAELKSFLSAVRTRSAPVVPLEDGRRALALALSRARMYLSRSSGVSGRPSSFSTLGRMAEGSAKGSSNTQHFLRKRKPCSPGLPAQRRS